MPTDRRQFLSATASGFAALAASGCVRVPVSSASGAGLGALLPDPAGLVDLPSGFSYRVLSSLGDAMDDGGTVPDNADGMGCFDMGDGTIALVRNHELEPKHDSGGANGAAYDTHGRSLAPLPGGTTTLVLDAASLAVVRQNRTLAGTIRNCAGGITPWDSWLSCEENTDRADGRINKDHGWVFEVPASASSLVDPVPLKAMGRFNHEAACVDPASGIVYMTEDRDDSLLYRFIPQTPGRLADGGRLQALTLAVIPDTRNWETPAFQPGDWQAAGWVDLDDIEAPEDDLRQRGAAKGASLFARGEGIWMGQGEFYFCCTSGGVAGKGQIFRLRPRTDGPDRLQLFYESPDQAEYFYGDNITIAPSGHLIVCEDNYHDEIPNRLVGVSPAGESYIIGRSRLPTEWAGACFSPDGKTLFVNLYSPARTLAITGPWPA